MMFTFEIPIYTKGDTKAALFTVDATWSPGGNGWSACWDIDVVDYTAVLIDAAGRETTTPTALTPAEHDALLPRVLEEARIMAHEASIARARDW